MNGKRAKAIRKRTKELLTALNVDLNNGNGEYEQVNNCISWEPAKDKDGKNLKDPDGVYLLAPMKNPGTITCKWKYRLFYKWLKKLYKKGDMEAQEIINATTYELLNKMKAKELKNVS